MARLVWILGAGFSRPLNGPLLSELMRPEVRGMINACFPQDSYPRLHEDVIDEVLRLYAHGRGPTNEMRLSGELIWQDAEQFLDYLDTATLQDGGPARRRLHAVVEAFSINSTIEQLGSASRRVVAASCCAFLEGADPKTERWLPYTEWAERLTSDDVIITFNYDRVVEIASKHVGLDLDVVLKVRHLEATRLYKLHGSVDWQRRGGASLRDAEGRFRQVEEIVRSEEPTFALTASDSELLIASPGPSKTALPEGLLSDVWRLACEEIREAAGVVFVGYRFPPSDAYARKTLIDALRGNTRGSAPKLSFALGSERTAEVVRMDRLLTYVASAYGHRKGPEWLPLGAEDVLLMNMDASLRE